MKTKTKWDLSPLFKNDIDPQIDISQKAALKASESFVKKWKHRNEWLADAKFLKEALADYEKLLTDHGFNSRACYYFHLRSELDKNNPKIKAGFGKAKEIAVQIQNELSFFTLKLAKIAEVDQKKFLANQSLSKYRHWLDRLFAEQKYLLSEAEEKIINLHWETSHHNWTEMLSGLIAKETRNDKSFPELISLIGDPNQKTRDRAFADASNILEKISDIAEAEFNAVLGHKKTIDTLRGATRPDELRLLGDDIESETVDAMISAVAGAFKISHRFYALKAKLLGKKKINYHERAVPIGKLDRKMDFDNSVEVVRHTLKKLDAEFLEIFDRYLAQGQIDVFPKKGRSDGAFCAHNRVGDPTYILLNHTGRLRDTMTIAHEFGHGANNELVKKKHGELYFETPVSTAEVASTFFEDWTLEEVGKDAGEKEKLALLFAKLDDDIASIFRQVAAYRFETEIHKTYREKGYLSKEEIGKIFLSHMKSYLGPAVQFPAGAENWWMYWNHLRNFFYVYSYASGLLISKALQKEVRADPSFIAKVKEFLSTGTSESPAAVFKKLGLDISRPDFWREGLAEIETNLNEAERLVRAMKKT